MTHTDDDYIKGLAWRIMRLRTALVSASLSGFEYEDEEDVQKAFSLVKRHIDGLEKQEFLLDLDTPPWERRNE